ncbi:MAG: hypothetical protein ACI9OJ_002479 [Myxococcota bacterium]|jgi:hypothetical protein
MSEEELPPRELPTRDDRPRSVWGEMWGYLKVRKKWWLAPMLVILLSLGALAVFTETSALAPFIYTLF